MKPVIKASLIAAAISFLPFCAQAAGLGEFSVRSKLGEPLDVEIQLNATQQELQSLSARIAPSDVFTQAGVSYASFVRDVRVSVENRGDRSVLKLTTRDKVNEAIASLIVQLNWDDGRVSRTYNFLLDPPDLAIRPPAPVEPTIAAPPAQPPVALESPPTQQLPEETSSTLVQGLTPELDLGDDPVTANYQGHPEVEPELAPGLESEPYLAPENMVTVQPESLPAELERTLVEPERTPPAPISYSYPAQAYPALEGDYTVRSGDTLGVIASRRVPADVTVDQMMMALYRANPKAFVNNNINRLKAGVILKIPSIGEIQSASHEEARREVRVHAREFNAWRAQLASEATARPASPAEESAGRTRSIDTVPPPAEQDRDKVVIASGSPGQSGDAARIRELEENISATQNALKESSERLKDLGEINEMQKGLIQERDRQIAELKGAQQAAAQRVPAPEPQQAVAETPAVPAELPPAPTVSIDETPVAPEQPSIEPAVAESQGTQESAPQEQPASLAADSDSQEQKDPLQAMLDRLTDPVVVGAIALAIAILGGFFAVRSYRNRRSGIGLDTLSQDATSMFPSEATSIFGDNGGQSVDTTGSSVIHTDFSQTGLSIDTNEGVDPVAEADVYMAYGRDSQAEEILNDALKADPKRGAIYVKLLEIYAQRQDLKQFEATASELFSRTEGQGRDWEKAAQMGRRLDPSNPLYSGGSQRRADQQAADASKLPGLEPALEEPSRLDMGSPSGHAGFGKALSDLDFGTSPATGSPATNTGQLKETVAVQGKVNDILSTRVADAAPVERARSTPSRTPSPAAGGTKVDFQFEPAETTPKAAGSIDFDLGRPQPVSETGKQPISVTVSRQSAAAADTASRKAGSRAAPPKATNDLVGPLEFGVSTQSRGGSGDMSETVVLPSGRSGNEHGNDVTLDLEKTSFDPNALDFDLDLDLKPDTAATASLSPKGRQSSVPASGPSDAADAEEIDTQLELALAYRDMGDNEGALELLREVADKGNAAQKAEAKALIANLS